MILRSTYEQRIISPENNESFIHDLSKSIESVLQNQCNLSIEQFLNILNLVEKIKLKGRNTLVNNELLNIFNSKRFELIFEVVFSKKADEADFVLISIDILNLLCNINGFDLTFFSDFNFLPVLYKYIMKSPLMKTYIVLNVFVRIIPYQLTFYPGLESFSDQYNDILNRIQRLPYMCNEYIARIIMSLKEYPINDKILFISLDALFNLGYDIENEAVLECIFSTIKLNNNILEHFNDRSYIKRFKFISSNKAFDFILNLIEELNVNIQGIETTLLDVFSSFLCSSDIERVELSLRAIPVFIDYFGDYFHSYIKVEDYLKVVTNTLDNLSYRAKILCLKSLRSFSAMYREDFYRKVTESDFFGFLLNKVIGFESSDVKIFFDFLRNIFRNMVLYNLSSTAIISVIASTELLSFIERIENSEIADILDFLHSRKD